MTAGQRAEARRLARTWEVIERALNRRMFMTAAVARSGQLDIMGEIITHGRQVLADKHGYRGPVSSIPVPPPLLEFVLQRAGWDDPASSPHVEYLWHTLAGMNTVAFITGHQTTARLLLLVAGTAPTPEGTVHT